MANSFWVKILKFVEKLSVKLANAVITIHDPAREILVQRNPDLLSALDLRAAERRGGYPLGHPESKLDLRGAKRRGNPSNQSQKSKITVIMNSVDPEEFNKSPLLSQRSEDPDLTGEGARQSVDANSPLLAKHVPAGFKRGEGIEGRSFIIIYNGTVVKLLNLTMIVNALNTLKDKMPVDDFDKIKFFIYGDGPALNEILQLAEDLNLKEKVIYKGFIPPDKMYDEILKASVLILPPLKNIYSDLFYTIKLIEMIYLKIPVIATRLNTYKRYYSEDAIFYFDSGNVEQLAEKIKEVFYNKDLVKFKTETAFSEYQSIGWDIMKDRYLNLIKNLTPDL